MRKKNADTVAATVKERKFALFVVQGDTYEQAYRKAGYDVEGKSLQAVQSIASNLANRDRIQKEIKRLGDSQLEIIERENRNDAMAVAALWSREDSVRALAELARLGMSAARQTQVKRDGTEVETLNVQAGKLAIDAIQQLNAMNGYDKAVGEEVPTIRVVLDEVEKYTV